MPFKKGQSGNLCGRGKGKPNKSTEALRGLIQVFIERNWNRIQADFDQMKPTERLTFLNSLLRHVLPEPITPERLTEEQLEQLHSYLKRKYNE